MKLRDFLLNLGDELDRGRAGADHRHSPAGQVIL
jgi:hypothetical protein